MEIGEIYNIGSPFEISNIELAQKLISKFNLKEKDYITYVEDRPFNDCRYNIDATKLRNLGWEPQVDFDSGLDKTSFI